MFDVALLNQDIPGRGAEVPHTGLRQEAAAVEILQPDINITQAGLQSSSSVHVSWGLVANISSGQSYHLQCRAGGAVSHSCLTYSNTNTATLSSYVQH